MARLLFTSDWQADFSNLQECEIILDELLAAADKYQPDAIIHAGDVKDQYSPVSTEVVKWCVGATRRIVQAGWRFIILLGNHDRISQSAESENWLSVLAAAGAEVVTKPKVKNVGTAALAFLPYSGDRESISDAARGLLARTKGHSGARVLVFHAEIQGALLNAAGMRGKGLSSDDLCMKEYDACFGGHIHRHQKIDDHMGRPFAWYIGSPFCQDWGEANARKGHLLVDVEPEALGVHQLRTSIPGWYDDEYLARKKRTPEAGAYIRSKVSVTTRKISDQILAEEERLRRKYGDNVRLHIVPVLAHAQEEDPNLEDVSDRDKIAQYVAATLPEEARFEADKAVTYMCSKLATVPAAKRGSGIRFLNVHAKNALVFKEVDLPLEKQGLVLIRGINRDWPKRSNGAGKTSLLSLLPIGLFGQTLKKGQKASAWAAERGDGDSEVELVMKAGSGARLEVVRRRPHALLLRVNGKDRSSGLRGTGKDETQGLIEQYTNYDFRTLTNAVYIDQSLANGFVFGSASERLALISRFQNLDRYEQAEKLVAADIAKNAEAFNGNLLSLEEWQTRVQSATENLSKLEEKTDNMIAKHREAELDLSKLIEQHAALGALKPSYDEWQSELDGWITDYEQEKIQLDTKKWERRDYAKGAKDAQALMKQKRCPNCGQSATRVAKKRLADYEMWGRAADREIAKAEQSMKKSGQRIVQRQRKMDSYKDQLRDLEREMAAARRMVGDLEELAEAQKKRNAMLDRERKQMTRDLLAYKTFLRAALGQRKALAVDRDMLEFVKKAFHRSGMPLYLASASCSFLNRAAEHYSDIFTDGNLRIRFEIIDGEFTVNVVNPAGSRRLLGQSVGESAMAGVIAAFALRETAPQTNLLILDEPGHGLDPEGARQFAQGLLKLKENFETILVVTHSPAVEAVLSGEKIWVVEKQNGWAKLTIM